MENLTLNTTTQVIEYRTLITTLKELQTSKNKIDDYIQVQTKSFSELVLFLKNWEMRCDFDTIVEDINEMFCTPIFTDNVFLLQEELNNTKEDVDGLEKAVKELENLYDELCQKSDRHGKKEVAQELEEFFSNSLRQIHVSQIRPTIDITIPGLITRIKVVLNAFEKENNLCAINISRADELIKLIAVFRSYADKFNSRKICASCEWRINPIKHASRIDPVADQETIEQVQKELDSLRIAYDEEEKLFDELENEIENNPECLWTEDHDEIYSLAFDAPSCMVESTIEEVHSIYEDYKEKKRRAIKKVVYQYGNMSFPQGKKILEHFRSEFDFIRANQVSKSKLDNLIGRIDSFVYKRRINILKKGRHSSGGDCGFLDYTVWSRDRNCSRHFMVS